MFCNKCGNQMPEGTKFCNNCGVSQEAAAQPAQAAQTAQPAAHKKNNTVKIAIIAAVAVVCFIIGSFVIAPSLSNKGEAQKPANNTSQSQNDNQGAETGSSNVGKSSNNIDKNNLKAIDGGYNTGKAFLSDMGEYGKMSIAVGYNEDNGVIRQVTASTTITDQHSEFASMKSDFDEWEERLGDSDDENIQVSYGDLGDNVSFIISLSKLNEADRAERVALAEEILDFVADEEDYAFYIDDITDLLVDTYGFEVVD